MSTAPPAQPADLDGHKTEAGQLVGWFHSHAKPFLENVQAEKVSPLEADARNLENFVRTAGRELAVCLLGSAGVGKSTLIILGVPGRGTSRF